MVKTSVTLPETPEKPPSKVKAKVAKRPRQPQSSGKTDLTKEELLKRTQETTVASRGEGSCRIFSGYVKEYLAFCIKINVDPGIRCSELPSYITMFICAKVDHGNLKVNTIVLKYSLVVAQLRAVA